MAVKTMCCDCVVLPGSPLANIEIALFDFAYLYLGFIVPDVRFKPSPYEF
jgi:hypothetical protein